VAHVYRFDDVHIDVQDFRLFKAGNPVLVGPKALNLLIFLVNNRGRLIERRELIDAVWGDAFVTDHVLNRAIGQLRKVLADDAKEPQYIETVPTRGYRFMLKWKSWTRTSRPVPRIPHLKIPSLKQRRGWPQDWDRAGRLRLQPEGVYAKKEKFKYTREIYSTGIST
jgi:DNA-binding winged helix-turn-helix (wHTH) protein